MADLIDYFIPDDFAADDIERRQAELAVRTVYVLVPMGLTCAGFVLWLFGSVWPALAVMCAPALVAVAPFALRRTGSMDLASLFILLPLFLTMCVWSITTGGVLAPGSSYLLLLPLLGLIFRGAKTALTWLAVVVVTWTTLFVAGEMELIATVEVLGERIHARRMSELLILGFTVFGLFYLKDSMQRWLVSTAREKEAENRAIVETAPDGILTVDLSGEVLSANEAAGRIFAQAEGDLVGRNIEELVDTLDPKYLREDTEDLTRFGVSEEHCASRDGEKFPLEIAFGLLEHEDGEPRMVLVFRDISARKEADRELRRARDEALEASRAKSTFLATMSHELRTPLNAVIGYAEMLTEEFEARRDSEAEIADIADRVIPDLGRIRSAGRHLLSIINDVLDLSKIEAGKMVARPENFELEELVHGVIDTVEPLAEKNDNELRLELEDDLGQMHSDATKVRQILVNLLSNAFKFTEEGTVTLTVRSDEADEEIVLEVEDTGIGMSQEELEGIFEAFTQVDGSSTRRFGGTGLGLTITRHLCTMLEGEIDMTSAPDEGTRVTARLPRHIEGPSAESDAEKTSETATVV